MCYLNFWSPPPPEKTCGSSAAESSTCCSQQRQMLTAVYSSVPVLKCQPSRQCVTYCVCTTFGCFSRATAVCTSGSLCRRRLFTDRSSRNRRADKNISAINTEIPPASRVSTSPNICCSVNAPWGTKDKSSCQWMHHEGYFTILYYIIFCTLLSHVVIVTIWLVTCLSSLQNFNINWRWNFFSWFFISGYDLNNDKTW